MFGTATSTVLLNVINGKNMVVQMIRPTLWQFEGKRPGQYLEMNVGMKKEIAL